MISRRNLLLSTAALAVPLSGSNVLAALIVPGERRLSLYNQHTGESVKAVYWADGEFIHDELVAISQVLRDHRTDEAIDIDTALLDQLNLLQAKVASNGRYEIISAYRAPRSNAKLYRSTEGVAANSYHMYGRAIDVRLPGVELKYLHSAALDMYAGGVGYYPDSRFIHLDSGDIRNW